MIALENTSLVQEFYEQWNSGAIDFERLIHPNMANHQPDVSLKSDATYSEGPSRA